MFVLGHQPLERRPRHGPGNSAAVRQASRPRRSYPPARRRGCFRVAARAQKPFRGVAARARWRRGGAGLRGSQAPLWRERRSRRPQLLCGSGLPEGPGRGPRIGCLGTACCVTLAVGGPMEDRAADGRLGRRHSVGTFFKDTRRGREKRRVCSRRSVHMAWPRRARSLTRPRL